MSIDSADRDAWLAARRNHLCASEVAIALREVDYRTREQLILEKAELVPAWEGNEQVRLGLHLEPAIAAAAHAEFGWTLEPGGSLLIDPQCKDLAATPDYFVVTPWGRGVVQIKMTTCQATEDCKPRKNGEPSTARYAGGAPLDYQIQVSAELAVTGLEWGTLLVLHACAPTFKLRAYPVRRNELAIARIRQEAAVFMSDVHNAKLRAAQAHEERRTA